ncbi:MAG: NmrA/HSCARG family protein [Myxococcota bacterium]
MSDKLKVLVSGATGQHDVGTGKLGRYGAATPCALTRHPDGEAARALAARGAEPVAGDFDDPASLRRALAGVDAVYAMSAFWERGVDAEVAQGTALVDAAKAANVGHFVYSSVAGADKGSGVPHFESKHRVEQALVASGLPWTVLAPVYFMENLLAFPQNVEGLKQGVYAVPLPADRALQQVAVADIGAMGAVALERRLVGRRLELAGDELTGAETAAALSRALGREIRYQAVPVEAVKAQSEDLYLMYRYFDEVGYQAPIAKLREEFPEVGWHGFSAWLGEQHLS